MHSLKRLLRDWLYSDYPVGANKVAEVVSPDEFEDGRTLRFNVTPCRGGVIVNVKNYNRRHERTDSTIYVIHDDENVGEKVSGIVSMELLSRAS
jgi:hypothetical protein